MEKIEIKNLSFKYPLSESLNLHDINLGIKEGEFVVICGKSGSGKSTLLRHIKKQLIPYGEKTGGVYIDGIEIEQTEERKSVSSTGYILQNPEVQIVTDKVWHEIAFGLENLGYDNSFIKRRVAEISNYFDILSWFERDIDALSGGEKQKLNLASVMAMNPQILLLDEPTAYLDPIATEDFINVISKLNKEFGITVVLSEHNLDELLPLADKLLILDEGRVIAFGEPTEIVKTLKDTNIEAFPPVVQIFSQLDVKDDIPLTVRSGKIYLSKYLDKINQLEDDDIILRSQLKDALEENANEKLIEVKNLWYKYDKNSDFIIKGANFDIRKKETLAIMGSNGSGKSTLLKLLCNMLRSQRGKIKNDKNLKICMVPQNPQALFTEITLQEELYAALNKDNTMKENIKKVDEMLSLMDLTSLAEANPYDLSGGEQQRLAIGKILLTEPDILLLDEPTKAIDPFFKRTLAKIFNELTEKKEITICMVSHDIEFCAEHADRCAMLFNGELISVGGTREFFAGNSFYTTQTNKLMRDFNPKIVTCKEAINWLKIQI